MGVNELLSTSYHIVVYFPSLLSYPVSPHSLSRLVLELSIRHGPQNFPISFLLAWDVVSEAQLPFALILVNRSDHASRCYTSGAASASLSLLRVASLVNWPRM